MPQTANTKILRVPLSWEQDNRQPRQGYDSLRVNVMDEVTQEARFTSKRPGQQSYAALTGTLGQGMVDFNGIMYAVIDDTLKSVSAPPNSGTNGSAFTTATVPSWQGRGAARALTFNGAMYILGGYDSFVAYADIWSSTDGGKTWKVNASAFPGPARQQQGVVEFKGSLFMFGGLGNSGALNDSWSSPDGTTWTQLTAAAPWSARYDFGYAATNNGIYLFGGKDGAGTNHNDVWYTTDGITWSQIATSAITGVRNGCVMLVLNNVLYVIGGINAGTYYNEVWSSKDGINWLQISVNPFASGRYGMGGCVYGGKLWVIGGGITGPSTVADVYSSANGIGAWTLATSTPGFTARLYPAVCVGPTPVAISAQQYNSLWVLGGYIAQQNAYYGNLNTAIGTTFALAPTVASQTFQFASFNNTATLLIKNQSELWLYQHGAVTQVIDTGYPAVTVPGIVVLGGFAYVMDPTGLIHNCDLNHANHWPSLNVLGADYEDDAGVALAKYLNYVVALGTYTTQVFYDAGLSNGSPLQPYLNANSKVGCADANSVAQAGSTLVWVSQTLQSHRQVVMFQGLQIVPISSPAIEKYLNDATSFNAFTLTSKGQLFYVVCCIGLTYTSSASFAYSFSTRQWYDWRDITNTAGLNFAAVATLFPGTQLALANSGGTITQFGDSLYDDGGPSKQFTVTLRTGLFDAGTKRRKFWGRLDVVGDQNTGTPSINWTDDDYQTYSTARTVDMSTQRPALFRCGSSRRRAWQYVQTDSNPMRLQALEVTYEDGE